MTDSKPISGVVTRLVIIVLLALTACDLSAATDVRMLIDVSGSMRKNDPENLRVPALRLVNELLPEGAKAGVWLFAEKTEVLAPPGTVDKAWKRKTGERLTRIHSRGLLTDIEQAIATGTRGWDAPAGADDERHLVLLTDGLVDVSKDDTADAASRERILGEQLERLKGMGVKVHAVGLSSNVDMALMRLLTKETGGWLETAQNADALQRIFLHMLEQTAEPTTVPIKGNRFEIDDQVSELTVLAFRAEGADTALISPSRERLSAKQHADTITWRTEPGYDLITIKDPEAGTWRLKGVEDPDNRVVVVTDLQIAAAQLPSALSEGEKPEIEVWLTDHGQPVTREDLLKVLTATAEISPLDRPVESTPDQEGQAPAREAGEHDAPAPDAASEPADKGPALPATLQMALDAQSGHFATKLDTQALGTGSYELKLVIDGGTFQRQTVKRIKVSGAPIAVDYDQQLPSPEDPIARIKMRITGEPDLIKPESLLGYLQITAPGGSSSVVEIPESAQLPLGIKVPVQEPGHYVIKGQLIATTLRDDSVVFRPKPHELNLDFPAPATTERTGESPKPPIQWLLLSSYVLGGNLLLGIILGLTWWLLKRSAPAAVIASETPEPKKAKTRKGS
ncbi:VWA domain-containing protein [Thiorhodococcus mannitoliphagus]|uniref:VWA domain-containing protein n=2 Tax=Thiorhodococcus mannitoliphagus TaxID=329406 RepID=A0A6P1DTU6_9GAMM|nr:VWA domain-containing protein [Thiorhodococcus mannitoliphagus]